MIECYKGKIELKAIDTCQYVISLLNNTNENTIPKIRNNDNLLINSLTHKIPLYIFQSDTNIKKELCISCYVRRFDL